MATLDDAELDRLRYELGYNVLTIGAEPYFWHVRVFDIIRQYVVASATAATTSSTAVAATGPASLTLASAAGIAAGARLVLDADDAAETVTARDVAGSVVSVVCQKTHAGVYPVEIESARTLVRGKISECLRLQRLVDEAAESAGIKRVDEVEFFGDATYTNSRLGHLQARQLRARLELATLCGLSTFLRDELRGSSSRMAVY